MSLDFSIIRNNDGLQKNPESCESINGNGKSVLNQKSELQRALEKREAVLRRETVKKCEENYKDDPRTALQRALEQRARQIELMEHPPAAEPPNPLVTARAKLRTRTDSQ
ncbi:Protein of unknown function [Cotesia congregata]|uniref:Uncharacterized protein n=1 Tax=Cotesia congregata TaxID=51543 RepID=A0A8J2MRM8_COTCN|nr:Protein of unknown function [Cotesia congregata]